MCVSAEEDTIHAADKSLHMLKMVKVGPAGVCVCVCLSTFMCILGHVCASVSIIKSFAQTAKPNWRLKSNSST